MRRVMSALLVASLCTAGSWAAAASAGASTGGVPAASADGTDGGTTANTTTSGGTTANGQPRTAAGPAARSAPLSAPDRLTPYDPARYVDLYAQPDGQVNGATYIFNPTVDWRGRMVFDFAQMRQLGVNTVGFYNLVQMTDADRDLIFTQLERNRQKAVVRIEWYDRKTFAFDGDGGPAHRDADTVLRYHNTDDRVHGYTALLNYLVKTNRLNDIAYFAINMPVDDGKVSAHYVTWQHPDGRSNPAWAASQPPYVDYLVSRLREILGGPERAKLYVSVFYGWDQTYPTPSYADIAHPADGYFLNNYSYPASANVPDETWSTSDRLNQPRLQTAMDRLVGQYPSQPKVIEYGFHTADFNDGVIPNQTAGLVRSVAAKRLALAETTAYYANGSAKGVPFRVRGTLYFSQNLFKPEGNPPAIMDWALATPTTRAEAEDAWFAQYYRNRTPATAPPVAEPQASGGKAITLASPGAALAFTNLTGASVIELRYRAARQADVLLSVNGAAPRTLRLPAAPSWRTQIVNLDVPLQGTVTVRRPASGASVDLDWVDAVADNEAELAAADGAVALSAPKASRGAGMILPAGRSSSLTIDPVRGGTRIQLRYAAAGPVTLSVRTGAAATTVELPATGGPDTFATRTVAADIRSGCALVLSRSAGAGDVAVDYLRVEGLYEAESSGGLYNGAYALAAPVASQGALATSFDVVGSSVVFSAVVPGNRVTFRYSADRDARMTILLEEKPFPVSFPNTQGALATVTVPVPIPANAVVVVERTADDQALGLTIDWMSISD